MSQKLEEYEKYVKNTSNGMLIELYGYEISLGIDNEFDNDKKEFYENRSQVCKKEILNRMDTTNLVSAVNKLICSIGGTGISKDISKII
jgi:hypothetical protein